MTIRVGTFYKTRNNKVVLITSRGNNDVLHGFFANGRTGECWNQDGSWLNGDFLDARDLFSVATHEEILDAGIGLPLSNPFYAGLRQLAMDSDGNLWHPQSWNGERTLTDCTTGRLDGSERTVRYVCVGRSRGAETVDALEKKLEAKRKELEELEKELREARLRR